jgi:hypothetical protein
MTEDKSFDWIYDQEYMTLDNRLVRCVQTLRDGVAVMNDPFDKSAWTVFRSGRAIHGPKENNIVSEFEDDVDDLTGEELEQLADQQEEFEREFDAVVQSKVDAAAMDHWQDGYRTAIRYALETLITYGDLDRITVGMMARKLLAGYECPIADPPF